MGGRRSVQRNVAAERATANGAGWPPVRPVNAAPDRVARARSGVGRDNQESAPHVDGAPPAAPQRWLRLAPHWLRLARCRKCEGRSGARCHDRR